MLLESKGQKWTLTLKMWPFFLLQKQRGNQRWIEDIEKDLHRNFPTHEMFGGIYEKIGQTELYHVLKAYSVQNPVDGYCQVQADQFLKSS